MCAKRAVAAFFLSIAGAAPSIVAADPFATSGSFSVTYTFTTSSPAQPIDIGNGRDLTVNQYLATTVNDAGNGFLHLTAGHCTNIRFTLRDKQVVDSRGYCQFRDRDGDQLFAEYTTGTPKPARAITITWTFGSGTGKYDGIDGKAEATNSNNIDTQGSYQAAGKMTGSYKIVHLSPASEFGAHD